MVLPIGSEESTITASYVPSGAAFKKATPASMSYSNRIKVFKGSNEERQKFEGYENCNCTITKMKDNTGILIPNSNIWKKLFRNLEGKRV